MSSEPPAPEMPLLASLRARQAASRTAQVARSLDVPARPDDRSFNAVAAAALSEWKQL
ncbi:hypothetical protein [Sphingomonas endophytica]|uniref:hypothetical protein n=1 Tax=Sphingomonas endophytica TaxID=869719 RepID=UPI000AF0B699|nr:hypothetical protein [Sphingomonas endophytica]